MNTGDMIPDMPWDLEGEGGTTYDTGRFYTSISSGEGSGSITVKMEAWMLRSMQVIVESRAIPAIATKSDLVRDAVYHRLRYILSLQNDNPGLQQNVADELSQNLEALALTHEVITRTNVSLQIEQQIRNLVRMCNELCNDPSPTGAEEARRIVRSIASNVEGMNPYWRARFGSQLREHLGHLM